MVSSDTLAQLKSTLKKHLTGPKYKAFIFGSRASGKHRKFSDLDIGIMGPSKVPASTLIQIQNDLSNSNIPYLTDVVDFSSVTDSFKTKALSNIINL